jgi:hypothetical protein
VRIAVAGAAGPSAAEVGTPLAVALAALGEDTLRFLRTLVVAPFRIAGALRRVVVA